MLFPEDEFEFEEEFGTEEDEMQAPDWVRLMAQRIAHEPTLQRARRNARRKQRGPRPWFLLSWFLPRGDKEK